MRGLLAGFSWLGWFLILLVIYMAIASPSTLGEVAGLIDRVFLAVMGGITQFLHSAIKGSLACQL